EHPGRRPSGFGVRLEQVRRLVLDELARHHGRGLDVHPVHALLDRERRHLLLIVARGSFAGDHAVLPPVPGAHHEFPAHPALAQRSPSVITDVGDSGETALVQKHGDLMPLDLEGEGNAREQLVARAEAVPGGHGRSREAWRSRTYRPSYAAEPSVGFITPGACGAV